jgi:hypothetical protein
MAVSQVSSGPPVLDANRRPPEDPLAVARRWSSTNAVDESKVESAIASRMKMPAGDAQGVGGAGCADFIMANHSWLPECSRALARHRPTASTCLRRCSGYRKRLPSLCANHSAAAPVNSNGTICTGKAPPTEWETILLEWVQTQLYQTVSSKVGATDASGNVASRRQRHADVAAVQNSASGTLLTYSSNVAHQRLHRPAAWWLPLGTSPRRRGYPKTCASTAIAGKLW